MTLIKNIAQYISLVFNVIYHSIAWLLGRR